MSEIKHWQSRPLTQILAVIAGYLPLYLFALWSHLSEKIITLKELFLYPLLLGGGNVILVLVLYKYICGEPLSSFHLKPGKRITDIIVGILLGFLSLGIMTLQTVIQSNILPSTSSPPAPEFITLINGIANNPLLAVIWLGPVVWIGVAMFEEITRVFMLNRLWKIWPRPFARWIFLFISAFFFGLVHIYQGPVNMVFVSVQGLMYGWYYLRYGRVWPLIIAHGIFDSVQVLQIVMIFSNG